MQWNRHTHKEKKKTQTAFFRHGHTLSKMPTDTHIHRTAQYTFFFFLMLLLYSMHQSFDVFSEEAANVFVRCWRGAEDGLHRPHRMQSARIQTRVCVCSLLTRNVPVSNKKKNKQDAQRIAIQCHRHVRRTEPLLRAKNMVYTDTTMDSSSNTPKTFTGVESPPPPKRPPPPPS